MPIKIIENPPQPKLVNMSTVEMGRLVKCLRYCRGLVSLSNPERNWTSRNNSEHRLVELLPI